MNITHAVLSKMQVFIPNLLNEFSYFYFFCFLEITFIQCDVWNRNRCWLDHKGLSHDPQHWNSRSVRRDTRRRNSRSVSQDPQHWNKLDIGQDPSCRSRLYVNHGTGQLHKSKHAGQGKAKQQRSCGA